MEFAAEGDRKDCLLNIGMAAKCGEEGQGELCAKTT